MIKLQTCCFTLFVLFISFVHSRAQTVTATDTIPDSTKSLSTIVPIHIVHFSSEQLYTSAIQKKSLTFNKVIVVITDTLAGIPIKKTGVVYKSRVVIPFYYDSILYTIENEFICRKCSAIPGQCRYIVIDALEGILTDPNASEITYIGSHVYDIKANHSHYFYNSISGKKSPEFASYIHYDSLFLLTNTSDEHLLFDTHANPFITSPFKELVKADTTLFNAVLYPVWDIYQNTGTKFYSGLNCDSILADSTSEKTWKLYRNGNTYYRRHITSSYSSNHITYTGQDNRIAVNDTAVYNRIKRRIKPDTIYFSSDRLFLYKKNKQYGYSDSAGNVKITHQYDTLTAWHDGMTAMRYKGKWGYLNKREKLTVQPYYSVAFPFYKDAALVSDGKRWSFINKEGKAVNSLNFDSLTQTPSGRWYVYSKGKMGLCDTNGKELLPPSFELLFDSGSDLIVYKSEHLYGLILKERTIVCKPIYDYFLFDETNDCYLLKHILETPLMFSINRKEP